MSRYFHLLLFLLMAAPVVSGQEYCFSEHLCGGPAILQPGTHTFFLVGKDGDVDLHDGGVSVDAKVVGFDLYWKPNGSWKLGASVDASVFTPTSLDESGTVSNFGGFASWKAIRVDAAVAFGLFGTDGSAFRVGMSVPSDFGNWLAGMIPGF